MPEDEFRGLLISILDRILDCTSPAGKLSVRDADGQE